PSGPPVPRRLERRTRSLGGPPRRDLLRLAPDGVWQAGRVTTAAGGLLPHRFTLTGRSTGGLLSVPLSVGFRRLGFPQRPALWCPDFPRTAETVRGHPACEPYGSAAGAGRPRPRASARGRPGTLRGRTRPGGRRDGPARHPHGAAERG